MRHGLPKRTGVTIEELEEEKRSIREKLRKMGFTIPYSNSPKNMERDERIIALFKEGKTLQEIGEEMGFTREYARQILKKYGLSGKNGGSHLNTINTRCKVEGCSKKGDSEGFCKLHYSRVMKCGDPLKDLRKVAGTCSVDGCNLKHKSNGYCNTHFQRWRTKGDPGSAEILPVGKHKNRGNRQRRRQRKLSDAQIAEIRSLYVRGNGLPGKPGEFSTTGLGKKFGVSSGYISMIVNNKI